MIEGFVRTAAAVPKIKVADPEFNASSIIRMIQESSAQEAALVVFPELSVSAYTCGELFHQLKLLRGCRKALNRIVRETADLPILSVVGFPFLWQGKLYNTAAFLNGGHVLALVPKRNLPNYTEFYEARWFTPGEAASIDVDWIYPDGTLEKIPFGQNILVSPVDNPDFTAAAEICEDLWVPDTPSTRHAAAGASLIVNCSASDETVGKDQYRRNLVSMTSARLTAAYIYANAGQGESTQDLIYSGHSLISENGSILAESRMFQTGIIYADVDLERLLQERARISTYPGCTGYSYRKVICGHLQNPSGLRYRFIDPHPFVPASGAERSRRCDEILSMQAAGLEKRLTHVGASAAVIGISGGLDSTLALLVTVRAFDQIGIPRKNITAVTMPAFGTTDRTYRNACTLTRRLGCTLREINISKAVLQHFSDISHEESNHNVVYENSQARERTQVLMDIANEENGLVIGTGDLSELALGWATYNGDHMSMYAVNVGVPKTLVRHLVQYESEVTKDRELSEALRDVLDTPVSPELLPPTGDGQISQKTEDLVGPYELHDFFLYQILRYGFSPRKVYQLAVYAFSDANLSFGGICRDAEKDSSLNYHYYDNAVILKWLRRFYSRFFSQQFKRSCLPDGPKVGSLAVSPRGDLRMPSDASSHLFREELDALTEADGVF